MIDLRPYQDECVWTILEKEDPDGIARPGRMVVNLPTGSGKTVIFAELCQRVHDVLGRCTIVLVHTLELIEQTADRIRTQCPGLNVGVVQADRNEISGMDVIVCSVQTLGKLPRQEEMIREVGRIPLGIVDECHHAVSGSRYETIMNTFPVERWVGFTATYNHNSKNLDDVWGEVVFKRDILDMINEGWLVDVKGQQITLNDMDLDSLSKSGGDFSRTSLSRIMMEADAQRITAEAYREYAADRQGIVFVPSVDAIGMFSKAFQDQGIQAVSIWGDQDPYDRFTALQAIRSHDAQVVVNCGVLTEGVDIPSLSCCVIARPTLSSNLYIQMVGRVLRPWMNKEDALVLDIVGATSRHSLAGLQDITSRRVTDIRPGESILQATSRALAHRAPSLEGYVMSWREIDLFASNGYRWLETHKGIYFIPVGDVAIFLWPSALKGYSVGYRSVQGNRVKGDWIGLGLDFQTAMLTAENFVREVKKDLPEGTYSRLYTSKRQQTPTVGQFNYAQNIGAIPRDANRINMTSAKVGDAIDILYASRVLDRVL